MLGLRSAMGEDVLIFATRTFKGIAQDRHAVKGSVVVDGLGERNDIGLEPSRVKRDRAEGVAKDAAKQPCLLAKFAFIAMVMVLKTESASSFVRSIVCRTTSRISGRTESGTGGSLNRGLRGAYQILLDLPSLVPSGHKAFPIRQTVCVSFRNFNSLSTSRIGKKSPDAAAAGNRKQPQLPIAHFAPQVSQHW
jgi:hypothetical protein